MHSSARANSEAVKAIAPLKTGALFLFLNLPFWCELLPEFSKAGAALYSRSMAGCSLVRTFGKFQKYRTMGMRTRNDHICFRVNSLVANHFLAKNSANPADSDE
jgi:hypothetical protein